MRPTCGMHEFIALGAADVDPRLSDFHFEVLS